MKGRRDTSSANLAGEVVVKKKRTKKPPLWHRIIYDDAMVALVRLLGHEGILSSELPDKAKPLIDKFGRERLQAVADEIVEVIGNGDDEIAQLTEQARKLAIQLIGRPRAESSTAIADSLAAHSPSSARNEPEGVPPSPETNSVTMPLGTKLPPSTMTLPAIQTASAAASIESATTLAGEQLEVGSRNWVNYETSCVAAFLNGDDQFADECLHLAKLCCERAAHSESVTSRAQRTEPQARTLLLADQLQRFVCEYNPLAKEEVSPFTELLDAALSNVDWHDLADSFLNRLRCSAAESDED